MTEQRRTPWTRRPVVRVVTTLLGLACAAYFVRTLWLRWPEIRALPLGPALAGAFAIAVLVHLGVTLLEAGAWLWLLRALGVPTTARSALGIFSVSQFAKYLPGNVGQHVGRVALAADDGLQSGRVVLSILVENGCALGGGALLALGSVWLAALGTLGTTAPQAGATLVVAGIVLGVVLLRRLLARPPAFVRRVLALDAGLELRLSFLTGYLGAHVLSYAAMAVALGLLVRGVAAPVDVDLSRVPLAATAGWLSGFLVPGAPAGLGVREAAVTAILGPRVGHEVAVTAVLLWRLSVMLGDLLVLLVGLALRRGRPSTAR